MVAFHQNRRIQKVSSSLLNSIAFQRQPQAGSKEFLDLSKYFECSTSRVLLERMHDTISNDPNVEPYVLWRLKEDSTKTPGLPGLPVGSETSFFEDNYGFV